MLLRSSSTPVLRSLISSISESPNHNHHHHCQPEVQPHTVNKPPPPTIPYSSHKKLSFHQSPSQNFTTFSCNSSPISSLTEFSSSTQNGFRRAQSEGNLESLANSSSNVDEFSLSKPPMKFARKPNSSLLQTIPSFSFNNTTSSYEAEDSDEEERFEFEQKGLSLNNSFGGEGRFEGENKMVMGLNEGTRYGNLGLEETIGEDGQQMYLARGLGVTRVLDIGFGSGGGGGGPNFGYGGAGGGSGGGDGGESLEDYYKRIVEENPGNPLFLRNYAQFLYQTKGDLKRAEEYYSRAILADSEDGEILSQYASLIWELHRDEDRAMSYFKRAVRAASEDSHVHAAYANFLWQIEDEDEEEHDEDGVMKHSHVVPPLLSPGAVASATA